MSIDFDTIRNANPLLEVINRYVEVVRRGGEYVGRCPFHDDTKPSLTIYNSNDGHMRYRCFACGAGSEGGDVIDFISAIENVDTVEACKLLTDGTLPDIGTFKPPEPKPDVSSAWKPICPVPSSAPPYDPSKTFNPKRGKLVNYRPTRTDPYYDHNGQLLCYVVRLDFQDGAKICPTITYCVGPGGKECWTAKRMPPPFPLQGLDELAKRPNDCVLVVSGEKCKQKIAAHMKKFVVVTWMGGDQTINNVDFTPLANRYVVYWPDADKSSKRSMLQVHNIIEKDGTG